MGLGGVAGVHHVRAAVVVPLLGVERPDHVQVLHLLERRSGRCSEIITPGADVAIGLNGAAVPLALGLEVPGVHVAGAAGHPEEDHALVLLAELLRVGLQGPMRTGRRARPGPWSPCVPGSVGGTSRWERSGGRTSVGNPHASRARRPGRDATKAVAPSPPPITDSGRTRWNSAGPRTCRLNDAHRILVVGEVAPGLATARSLDGYRLNGGGGRVD